MTKITYILEKYFTDEVTFLTSSHDLKIAVRSVDLDAELEIRSKNNYHWYHFWMPVGSFILSKIWKNFDLDKFKNRYSTRTTKTLYCALMYSFVVRDQEYVTVPYDLLEHELKHAWQANKYFLFSFRYSVSKTFRLRREIEAYIFGYKDKINPSNEERYAKSIFDSLTGGLYFASIKDETVSKEIKKQMDKL